ncbi:MAG TPA: NAD(P)-binding protein, partial [Nitrosopumilaceae archaeon]|nr:NAD(P)-binding protein [Nitrosopumilaceae archaeon]
MSSSTSLNIFEKPTEENNLNADVCIVGTGAAGSVLAYELSKNDFDVVMMEKGGYYDMEFMKKENEENLAKLWKNKGIFISKNFAINIA